MTLASDDHKMVHWCLILSCKTTFNSESDLDKHYSEMHTVTEVDEAKADHVKSLIPTALTQRIIPDKEFLTQNTKDLEAMLREIPIEALYTGLEEFNNDFKDILNEKHDEVGLETSNKFHCDQCKFKAKSRRAMRVHNKFVHDTSFYSCNTCQSRSKTVHAMKIHMWKVHKKIVTYKEPHKPRKEEVDVPVKKVEVVVDTSEVDDETDDTDFDDIPELYKFKEWESGCNFKGRTPAFEKALTNLRAVFRKSPKEKSAGGLSIRVIDVSKKKGGGKQADIVLTDDEGSGQVQFQTFGPSKKSRGMTTQVVKSSKGDIRHVGLFVNNLIKPILDRLLTGESVTSINKTFFKDDNKETVEKPYKCPVCTQTFKTEKPMKTHFAKFHKDAKVTQSESDRCKECTVDDGKRTDLKKHKSKNHESSSESNSPEKKRPRWQPSYL